MSVGLLGTSVVVMGLIFVGYLAYDVYNKKKEKDSPTGRPIVIHFMPEFSGSHALGVAENVEMLGERIRIDFTPRSINYQKELNKNKGLGLNKEISVKTYPIFFDKGLVDFHSDMDGHVTIIEAYPSDMEQVPSGVKIKKPWILERINNNQMKKDEMELMKESNKNLKKIGMYNGGGELVKDIISKQKEILKDFSPNKDDQSEPKK